MDTKQTLLHLDAVQGGPLPWDAFAGLGVHVLQHSTGRDGEGAVDLAPVIDDHMSGLAVKLSCMGHVGDMLELVILLLLPVESTKDLF